MNRIAVLALAVVLSALSSSHVRAQNATLKQVGVVVTNAAVITPSLCSDAGVCPGVATYGTSLKVIGCWFSVTGNTVNMRDDGTSPTNAATGEVQWSPGLYWLVQSPVTIASGNLNKLKVIATGANAGLAATCYEK